MKREIGSEFWNIPLKAPNGFFSEDTEWFSSGRSALQAIIADIKKIGDIKTAALPDWCCDSMIKPFRDAGIAVSFYPAMESLPNTDSDAVLVMDYFGYTGHSGTEGYNGTVIRDVTHSVFSEEMTGADYCFGSLRKWAGFWGGGFAKGLKFPVEYTADNSSFYKLRDNAMLLKDDYICEKYDSKEYLKVFSDAEELLENTGIASCANRDIECAAVLDVDFIRSKRRENAAILLNGLYDMALFKEIKDGDCPMFVPIMCERRDDLRRYLTDRKIYCPVHWQISPLHEKICENTMKIYNGEISIVCDQRYDADDMRYILSVIKAFSEE